MNFSSLIKEIELSKYKIYCDLDGVITDFNSRYQHFTGLTPEEMDKELIKQYGEKKAKYIFWDKVNDVGPKFWEEMEFMSDAHQLLDFLKPYEFKFLSSPSRSATSKEGKINWVKKHFPNIELILRQANQKQEFSEPNSILIDDKPSNIEQWKAKGGIGILHKSASNTIKQLEKLGFKNQVKEIQITTYKAVLKRSYRNITARGGNYEFYLLKLENNDNILWDEYQNSGTLESELLDSSYVKMVKEFLDKRKIPYKLYNNEEFIISNFKKYFKIEGEFKSLDEIQIKSYPSTEEIKALFRKLVDKITKISPDYDKQLNDLAYKYGIFISLDIDDLNKSNQLSFYNELLKFKQSYNLKLNEIQVKQPDKWKQFKIGDEVTWNTNQGEFKWIKGYITKINYYLNGWTSVIKGSDIPNNYSDIQFILTINADEPIYKYLQSEIVYYDSEKFKTLKKISPNNDLNEIQIRTNVVTREKIEKLGNELLMDYWEEVWPIIKNYRFFFDYEPWPDFLIALDQPQLNSLYKELVQFKILKNKTLDEIQIKPKITPNLVANMIKFLNSKHTRFNQINQNINNLFLSYAINNDIPFGEPVLEVLTQDQLEQFYKDLLKIKKEYENNPDNNAGEIYEIQIKQPSILKVGEFYSINFYKARHGMPKRLDQWTPPNYRYLGIRTSTILGNKYHIFDQPNNYNNSQTVIDVKLKNWYKNKEEYIKDKENAR